MEQRSQRRNLANLAAAGAAVFAIATLAPVTAQDGGGGLSIPVVAAGQPGRSGVLRITQFTLQDARTAVAIGTLSASATGGDGHRTVVTQVAVPVIRVTSSAVSSGGGVVARPATAGGGTQASGGLTSGTGQAGTGVATAGPAPGQVATCGPLHVALGPLRVEGQNLSLNVPRLDIDIDAGLEGGAAATVSQSGLGAAVCSVDAALAASRPATGGFAGTGSVSGTAGAAAGTTAGVTGTSGGGAAGGAATTQATTPLQNLVAALNGVLASM